MSYFTSEIPKLDANSLITLQLILKIVTDVIDVINYSDMPSFQDFCL